MPDSSARARFGVGVGLEEPINEDSFYTADNDGSSRSANIGAALFLIEAFNEADTDGDGKLSYEELKDLLQTLGLKEDKEKLNKFVTALDMDGNGTIDLAEFQSIVNMIDAKTTVTFEQQLREIFDLYDADGSGNIDQAELAQLMATLGYDLTDQELHAMIAEVDMDRDGDIDYEEFVALFKGALASEGKRKKTRQQQQQRGVPVSLKRNGKEGTIFDDAKQFMTFGGVFRFVTWLHRDRKMILLACSHFVATMVIWAHFALIKFQQQESAVPEGAPRYWAKRLVPPIEFGSMHAILFQMALIPFTMSRYTIASFSNSRLNKYLPLEKAVRIHIHLGYTMVTIVFSATIVFFTFFGLSCSEGEEAFCDKFTSEIMITGYCILGLLLLMAGTAFFRHSIPYELFYGVHFLFLAMYAIAVAHTLDMAQRSGKKDRSQTFKWFAAPLIYYLCDYATMWYNQRFKTRVTSFTTIEESEGSKMLILKMKRPSLFVFQPGQYAFLRVESIDRTWHPFSIASDPDSNTVEFYIEVFGEGSWTNRLWAKLNNQDKGQKMYIDLLGPYGTALVKNSSYTNIVAIGTGTGIVPCTSLLKQHVRKMVMMEPEHYFAERSEEKKRSINILAAQEGNDGSLVSHLLSTLKDFLTCKHRDFDEDFKGSSAESLKAHARRQSIHSSMNEYMDLEAQRMRTPNLNRSRRQSRKALKRAIFQATKPVYGRTILTFITLYSLTVFSLNLSWNLTSADLSSDMFDVLEIMTELLHAIFFLYSFFIWRGSGLQSYFDAAISIMLPFIDWHFILQISLSTGQIIILSLLNGYISFRFYQKTLATVSHQAVTLKESVEHLRFIWSVRTVKVARQILPEINETYQVLVKEWGEEYAQEVLDITIYVTEKDKRDAASFRAQIRDFALFKSRKVVFVRPKLGQIVEKYVAELIEFFPAYSSTLIAFCGGPKVSRVVAEARSTVELLAAATGYSSHHLDFVSESYGGAKSKPKGIPKEGSKKKEDPSESLLAVKQEQEQEQEQESGDSLWDAVRNETMNIMITKRVESVFEDEDEFDGEYKSKRDLMDDYHKRGGLSSRRGLSSQRSGLRQRSIAA